MRAQLPIVFPVHPRTRERLRAFGVTMPDGVIMTEPLGYIDFLSLTSNARIVLTDSGGLQEESTALGIPCLTLRENTERPATVTDGTNRIVGTRTAGDPCELRRRDGRPRRRRAGRHCGTARRSAHRRRAAGISVEMNWSTFVTRGKKALRMPPRVLLARLQDEVRQQTKRPWATAYPHLLTDRTVLGGATSVDAVVGVAAGVRPVLPAPGESRTMDRQRFDRAIRDSTSRSSAPPNAVVRHEFDLLGSGPVNVGGSLPWHSDFKTGREWPVRFCQDIEYLELDRPSDVKVPWELSRAQHFPALGQAYWLTGDERYAREFVAEVEDWIDRNPLALRRELGLRDGRGAARRQLDVGLLFHGRGRRRAPTRTSAAKFVRSLYMHGEFVSQESRDLGHQRQSLPERCGRPGFPGRAVPRHAGWRAVARDR